MTEAEKKRKITAHRIAHGICVQCGNTARPLTTLRYCDRCAALRRVKDTQYKKMRRDRYRSVQFCTVCGEAEVTTYTRCMKCRVKQTKFQRDHLLRRREPCIQCGALRSHTAITKMCRACAYKYVWSPKMNAKRKKKAAA